MVGHTKKYFLTIHSWAPLCEDWLLNSATVQQHQHNLVLMQPSGQWPVCLSVDGQLWKKRGKGLQQCSKVQLERSQERRGDVLIITVESCLKISHPDQLILFCFWVRNVTLTGPFPLRRGGEGGEGNALYQHPSAPSCYTTSKFG